MRDSNGSDPPSSPSLFSLFSLFSQLIADNISSGCCYEYLPADEELDQAATLLRQQLSSLCGQDGESSADFPVTSSCVPGFVVYELSVAKLQRIDAAISDRIQPFLYIGPADETVAYAATLEPVSRSYQYFALIQVSRVQRLVAEGSRAARSCWPKEPWTAPLIRPTQTFVPLQFSKRAGQ